MIYKLKAKEAGAAISSANMQRIQSIHDNTMHLGAACGSMLGGGGLFEAERSVEAALPFNASHDALRGHLRDAIKTAHGVSGDSYYANGPYVSDVFPGHVVYSFQGQTHKRTYAVDQGAEGTTPKVTLGNPSPVHVAYVDTKKESLGLLLGTPLDAEEVDDIRAFLKERGVTVTPDDDIIVRESSVFCSTIDDIKEAAKVAAVTGKATTIPVCIITPGWGSSAYYSPKMIKESGPKVFKKGTHMYWNHATNEQEASRPEGDLNDLAAVLTKDSYWDDNGPKGAGLYSDAKVFSDYATQVSEKGPHIGVSINAAIKGHEGEIEGKTGKIADAFVHAYSTDFVTKAGRGGSPIVPVQESQRGGSPQIQESITMTEQELTAQKALADENVSLKGRLAVMEASQNQAVAAAAVATVLREAGVTFKPSLVLRACANPTVKEGKIDQKWIEEVAADFTEDSRGVVGLGTTQTRESADEQKNSDEKFKESLLSLGVPEKGLSSAMGVRR